MDDALLNCMTGVCCPMAVRVDTYAKYLLKHKLCAEASEAHAIAAETFRLFDVAPAGSLLPFMQTIARIAKA